MFVFDFFEIRPIARFTSFFQGCTLVFLYCITVFLAAHQIQETGLMFGYPPSVSMLFVPIYEEMIFRGVLFSFFLRSMSVQRSIFLTSILFGLWHLKNLLFLPIFDVTYQMLYAGLCISPIFCLITYRTRSIWPSVLLHYCINLFAGLFSLSTQISVLGSIFH